MSRARAITLLILLTTWLPAATACHSQPGSPPGQPGKAEDSADAVWPFWPERMRLHPLTRLTSDAQLGRPIIECRVEFQDIDGQTTKATGQVRFELVEGGSDDATAAPRRSWPEQDLRDLKTNRLRFDDVTRTYLFPIDVKADDLAGGPRLWAYFLSADGRLMKDSFTIRP